MIYDFIYSLLDWKIGIFQQLIVRVYYILNAKTYELEVAFSRTTKLYHSQIISLIYTI